MFTFGASTWHNPYISNLDLANNTAIFVKSLTKAVGQIRLSSLRQLGMCVCCYYDYLLSVPFKELVEL